MKRAVLLLAAVIALPAAAQVHKWIDNEGRVHYGDRVPPGKDVKASELRGTVSVANGMTVVPEFLKGPPAKPHRVASPMPNQGEMWIYTTPRCGYCRHAKEHMRLKGIPFVEKDIQDNPAYRHEFRALGGKGVPLTLAGSSKMAGYSEERYEQFLKAAGL